MRVTKQYYFNKGWNYAASGGQKFRGGKIRASWQNAAWWEGYSVADQVRDHLAIVTDTDKTTICKLLIKGDSLGGMRENCLPMR